MQTLKIMINTSYTIPMALDLYDEKSEVSIDSDDIGESYSFDVKPTGYVYEEGFMSNALHIGKECTDFGFKLAHKSTAFSLGVAKLCFNGPAVVTDMIWGEENSVSKVLRGVHTTIGAAEVISLAAIYTAHAATAFSLNAVDSTLEFGGAATGYAEQAIGNQIKKIIPNSLTPYTEALAAVTLMVVRFHAPLRGKLSNFQINRCVATYALLQQRNRLPISVLNSNSTYHSHSNEVIPQDIVRSMGFAAAAYGHIAMNFLSYVPKGKFVPACDLLPVLAPGVEMTDIIDLIEETDDNSKNDLKSGLYHPGYLLVADHTKKQIVLAIRGSMSLNDCVTNLTCEHVPIKVGNVAKKPTPVSSETSEKEQDESSWGSGYIPYVHDYWFGDKPQTNSNKNSSSSDSFVDSDTSTTDSHYAHKGFVICANNMDKLLRKQIYSLFHDADTDYANKGYTLLICGHSLGAGVASILTLKWVDIFPHVRCISFSPPCVLSLDLARQVQNRITSIAIGDDVVCRLGLNTCLDLRDACLAIHETNHNEIDMNHIRSTYMSKRTKLYPAGRIIHIVHRDEWDEVEIGGFDPDETTHKCLLHHHEEEIAYIADQTTFSEMHISGTMFSTHLPHVCLNKLKEFFPECI